MNLNPHQEKEFPDGGCLENTSITKRHFTPGSQRRTNSGKASGGQKRSLESSLGTLHDPHPGSSQLKALGRDNVISVPSSVSLPKALLGRLHVF